MANRRSQVGASIVALLAAISLWLSAGTVAVISGDTHRIAALPSVWILLGLAIAAVVVATMARLRLEESWPLLGTLLVWLPFLPGNLPPPFLIWQGPAEAFVWAIAIAGVIAVRLRKAPSLLANPDRAPWIAGAIVAVAALAVFSQVRGVIPGGDEPHYLAATQSILKDFDLRVANNYADGDYLDYFPGRLEPHFLKRSTGGEIYSIHAPGVSIVVLPAFAVAGYAGAVMTMILIAALTAAITWLLARRVSGSVAGAWAGVAAVFTTTPYFFHTFTIYPEIIGSLCVAIGAWLLVDLADGREVTSRRLAATGAALALLPWLHSRFAVIAAALGVVIVLRLRSSRSPLIPIARFLSVPAIAGAAWFAFFWMIWGSPSPVSPYGADTSTSAAYIPRGLIGLMIDQQFGLIATAPIYLIAIAGLVVLARRRPRLTVELALVAVPYAIAVASYAMWWAGSAAPARFLVSILPLAALLIAVAFSGLPQWRMPVVILLVISIGLMLPRAFVEGGRFIFNNRSGVDATLEWLNASVDLSMAVPSVHRDGGSIAVRDAMVWIAVLAVVALFVSLVRRTAALRWMVVTFAMATGAMVAAGIVWAMHAPRLVSEDRSALAALGAYRSAWHRIFVDVSEKRLMTKADFLGSLTFPIRFARINRIPAGEYEVRAATPPTTVALKVGRNDGALDSPMLDPAVKLPLPVSLQTLNFSIVDGMVPEDAPAIWIAPLSVRAPAASRFAIHAARYGHARAFFFDEQAYPEKDGFWTRANGAAEVVIDTDRDTRLAGLPITVTAGAADTDIAISVGSWTESFPLAAGQKHELMLPPADQRTWRVVIRSGPGFRPSERDPGNRDVRSLAAWIAIH